MNIEEVKILYVKGRNLLYCIFQGRINIKNNPITVVRIIVPEGNLNM